MSCNATTTLDVLYSRDVFYSIQKKKRYGIIKKSKFLENGASEAEKIYPNGHSYIVQSYKRVSVCVALDVRLPELNAGEMRAPHVTHTRLLHKPVQVGTEKKLVQYRVVALCWHNRNPMNPFHFFLYFGVVSNENQHTYGRRAVMMVNESSSHTEKEKREEKRNRRLFRFSSSFTLPRFAFPLSYSVNQSRERERSSHSTLLNFHINVTHITV